MLIVNFSWGILLHNHIMKRHALIFGLVGGLLIATLQYTEYRFASALLGSYPGMLFKTDPPVR
jgi:hypothetical protein